MGDSEFESVLRCCDTLVLAYVAVEDVGDPVDRFQRALGQLDKGTKLSAILLGSRSCHTKEIVPCMLGLSVPRMERCRTTAKAKAKSCRSRQAVQVPWGGGDRYPRHGCLRQMQP